MNAVIIGAGLVGSLWAVYLNKAGYKVTMYEKRSDMRKVVRSAGRSINLATSYRGWKALDDAGVGDEIRKIAIPMYGRGIHSPNGDVTYQPYGNGDQAIYSVSRGDINATMMDIAEREGNTQIHFHHTCVNVDSERGICHFKNTADNTEVTVEADLIFACDGTFSSVRYHSLQKTDRFNYSQEYVPDGYKEILLPANPDGSYKLDKNSLHIWPKGRFMLIALPNFDGSFTCTLFMPIYNEEYCFSRLDSKESVESFFKEVFPDFYRIMPNVADTWDDFPMSSLAIIRCFPWTHGKVALMGDAAHATVPFYGQGMNCGLEDCTVMWSLMQQYGKDWEKIFKEYEISRKPNGDAMQDLSLQNYIVMRDKVADPDFLLLQKIERRINYLYPDSYFPLYSMVSFTGISYKEALEKGLAQEKRLQKFIKDYHITAETSDQLVDQIIHKHIEDFRA
jgi:kynurenine 3-monooxygenase